MLRYNTFGPYKGMLTSYGLYDVILYDEISPSHCIYIYIYIHIYIYIYSALVTKVSHHHAEVENSRVLPKKRHRCVFAYKLCLGNFATVPFIFIVFYTWIYCQQSFRPSNKQLMC